MVLKLEAVYNNNIWYVFFSVSLNVGMPVTVHSHGVNFDPVVVCH
uniref:Uncharacterized protein n=1 Tax=Anguilla anguilla TaxID=7936 RepID=A0A0E9QV65_ANGAN